MEEGKKREIKSLVFKVADLKKEKKEKLIGYIAYIKTVEPCFVDDLKPRYPENIRALYNKN